MPNYPVLLSVTIFEVGNLPRYSATTVMHGIFWMVIGRSGTCYRGTQPHGIERHFLDGNRPLWYMLPWYSTPTVMHGIFWMVIGHSGTFYCGIQPPRKCMVYFIFYIFLGYSRVRVVLRCQYVHRTRKSPDLKLEYKILRRTQ